MDKAYTLYKHSSGSEIVYRGEHISNSKAVDMLNEKDEKIERLRGDIINLRNSLSYLGEFRPNA